jgi:transposase-like protein
MKAKLSAIQLPEKLRMVGHGAKFGNKMLPAIAALMSKSSVEESARAIGVSANTLLRWIKEPMFDKAYREARETAFSQSLARLQESTGVAVTTLLEIMRDKRTAAALRVRAADLVLVHAGRATEGCNIVAADKTPRSRVSSHV